MEVSSQASFQYTLISTRLSGDRQSIKVWRPSLLLQVCVAAELTRLPLPKPVSYTHLDVYKRQVTGTGGGIDNRIAPGQ